MEDWQKVLGFNLTSHNVLMWPHCFQDIILGVFYVVEQFCFQPSFLIFEIKDFF